MELIAHMILSHFRIFLEPYDASRRSTDPEVNKPRMLCKKPPDGPEIMKLTQYVHVVTLTNIHERYMNRSTTRGVMFV